MLIAVNRNNKPIDVVLHSQNIPAPAATVIGENRSHLPASAGELHDHFDPYECGACIRMADAIASAL